MSNIDQIVIENIKKYLQKTNTTQQDFAKKINCNEATFCRYLKYERKLPLVFAVNSSKAMNISICELIRKDK